MVYRARLLISGRQKIALALLVLAVGLFLAYYPRITEALLAFLLGGEIPGTKIVVSPNVVIATIIGVFVAGVITAIIRVYFRTQRRSRNFKQIPVTAISQPVAVTVTSTVSAVPVTIEEPKDTRPALRRRHRLALLTTKLSRACVWFAHIVSVGTQTSAIALWQVLRSAGKFIWKVLSFIVEAVYTLLYLIWAGGLDILKFISRSAVRFARWADKISRKVHGWVLPQLRRFDTWLELQMRRIENRIKRGFSCHETVRSVAAMGREYRKSVNELHARKVVQNARRQAAAIKTIKTIKTKAN